jgi:hypothetical protein
VLRTDYGVVEHSRERSDAERRARLAQPRRTQDGGAALPPPKLRFELRHSRERGVSLCFGGLRSAFLQREDGLGPVRVE